MAKRTVNLDELEFRPVQGPGDFSADIAAVGELIGARQLGYNVVAIQPGKKNFPYHYHTANEEFFFVISGSGRLRYNGEEIALRAGDFVAAPAGEHSAHQIINDSDEELRFLALSTKHPVEIVGYPDSNKISISAPLQSGERLRKIFKDDSDVGYWQDES